MDATDLVTPPPVETAAPVTRRSFTGAEWDRLVELGFFGPDERLELLDGEVLVMSPIGSPHETVASLLVEGLRRALLPGRFVREEKTLRVGANRLYPDLVVVQGAPDDYLRRAPTGRDAALVVEVADTTVALDLGRKAEAYAAGGVAEYWGVSLPDQVVVVHSRPRRQRSAPKGWAWSSIERVGQGRLLAPACRRALRIAAFLRPCA